jgi:hypothetical protein
MDKRFLHCLFVFGKSSELDYFQSFTFPPVKLRTPLGRRPWKGVYSCRIYNYRSMLSIQKASIYKSAQHSWDLCRYSLIMCWLVGLVPTNQLSSRFGTYVSYVKIYIDFFHNLRNQNTHNTERLIDCFIAFLYKGLFFLPLRSILFLFKTRRNSSNLCMCFGQVRTRLIISPL